MAIFEVKPDRLVPLNRTSFSELALSERGDLQRLFRDQIETIADDVCVIAEEFSGWDDSRRRIDLLGVDRTANLVVIELKRTEDGGHMELQAIRYAAMVSRMTFQRAVEVYAGYLKMRGRRDDARDSLLRFLSWAEPDEEKFAPFVRIVLTAAEFSEELMSSVMWLNDQGLDIRCVRLSPHADGDRVFLDVQQVLPLPEAKVWVSEVREKQAEARQARAREAQWSGLWFVNIGMDDARMPVVGEDGKRYGRHWDNCVTLGYVAAGGGERYSDALKRLAVGDQILAYQKGRGYLGYGIVTAPAAPIDQFRVRGTESLAEFLNSADHNSSRPKEKWEYAVAVDWKAHTDLEHPKTFKGIFANQNVVCRLKDLKTIQYLRQEFQIAVSPAE